MTNYRCEIYDNWNNDYKLEDTVNKIENDVNSILKEFDVYGGDLDLRRIYDKLKELREKLE